MRDRLIGQRTALTNQMCSILLERRIGVPYGCRKLLEALQMLSSGGAVSAWSFGCDYCSMICSISGVASTGGLRL
jgi:hypothetical protein